MMKKHSLIFGGEEKKSLTLTTLVFFSVNCCVEQQKEFMKEKIWFRKRKGNCNRRSLRASVTTVKHDEMNVGEINHE